MLTKKKLLQIQKSFRQGTEHISHVFAALGDPTRLKIFRLLAQKQDLCVSDIASVCGMSVPAASYQLKILERAGLVQRERMGKTICYELRKTDPIVKKVMSIVQ